VIALVVRGHSDSVQSWVKTLPLDVEITQVVHHDEGLVILSLTELEALRAGRYSIIQERVRKKLQTRRWNTPAPSSPNVPSEPTKPTEGTEETEP